MPVLKGMYVPNYSVVQKLTAPEVELNLMIEYHHFLAAASSRTYPYDAALLNKLQDASLRYLPGYL